MLNKIWPVIILVSTIYGIFSGNISALNNAIYNSSKDAIDIFIVLIGATALWSGVMKILSSTKIIELLNIMMNPIMRILFPDLKDKKIRRVISMNIISNLFGLGNAATPLGVQAMILMHDSNNRSKKMSDSMKMLILINTTSIQLIPTTIIAIRNSLGARNPSSIILPVWGSTIASVCAGIVLLKKLDRKKYR